MSIVKGTIEANITLSKSTCYYMKTGKCSLNLVSDYYISAQTKTAANDLLYCPRLFRAMSNRERMKPILITPCECGHAEVVSAHQRACIASRKGLSLAVKAANDDTKEACRVCDGQVTFEENVGGERIISFRAIIHKDG